MIQVAIPSYKRAGRVKSFGLFPASAHPEVWVPESQYDSYAAKQPELALRAVPDQFDGHGMAVKRNYMLDTADADVVIMVDDDVKEFRRWEGTEARALSVDEIGELVEMGSDLASQIGSALWSPNIKADPRAYSKLRPFSLLSPVLGPFTGVVRTHASRLRYDTRFKSKEDYDFWLQAIYYTRRTLRLNQFCFLKKEEQTGGLARTFDDELAEARVIERKWGDVIRYAGKKSLLDGTIHMPIPGC